LTNTIQAHCVIADLGLRIVADYLTPKFGPRFLVIVIALSASGCATLGLTKKDDEYDLAKRSIESYQDKDGNYIRPEGIRADKQKKSDLPKFLQSIPGIGPKPKNEALAKSTFEEAEKLYEEAITLEGETRADKFYEAGKRFDKAGKNWVSSYLELDAMFWAGESYFFSEDYNKAEDRYVKLLKEYPRNRYQDRVDKRRMEIGNYWLQFPDRFYHVNFTDKRRPWNDTAKHGVRVLEKVRLDSPTGKLADDVTMELANNAFRNEKWIEALDTYRDLITTYPDSRHLFDAHFLGLKAALESYRGPDYSQEALDHAEKLIKQMRQFPEEARREKTEIDRMYTELINRRAEYKYNRAQYYFNKGEARASRVKCEELLKDYENTVFAEPARELLAKTKDMPDEPTPYLKWVGDMFPTNDKLAPLLKPLPAEAQDSTRRDEIERTANPRLLGSPSTSGSLGPR
jgi:outer membrane protein assembly factor BamD (BamD/ComL family)